MERKSLIFYISFLLITLIFLFLIKYFNIYYPLHVTNRSVSSELAVVGVGKVDVIPDTATIDLGIAVSNAPSVDEAQKGLEKINNNIINELIKLNIAKEDIKTSNYSITPNYSYDQGNQNKIVGYNGNVTIAVMVRTVNRVGIIIQESTKAGANQVNGTNYSVKNPDRFRQEAREKAISNARLQAQKLAQSLGIRLGKISNIVESTPNSVGPIYAEKTMGIGSAVGAPPIMEPGTQTITSEVTLYFEKR